MGVLGYWLRKFNFDPAPLVLGLVIASNGDYLITQLLARSFPGGFRTTAPVQVASSRWTVIRNPSPQRTQRLSLSLDLGYLHFS
jgi:hypothetical protein